MIFGSPELVQKASSPTLVCFTFATHQSNQPLPHVGPVPGPGPDIGDVGYISNGPTLKELSVTKIITTGVTECRWGHGQGAAASAQSLPIGSQEMGVSRPNALSTDSRDLGWPKPPGSSLPAIGILIRLQPVSCGAA